MGKFDQLLKRLHSSSSPASGEAAGSLLQQASHMLLEYIGQGAVITDVLGRVEYLNPMAEQYLGWTRAETRGLPVSKIIRMMNQATGLPMANPIRKVLVQGRMMTLQNQVAMVRRNGQLLSVEGNAAPLFGSNGRRLGVMLMFHDVSKNREIAHNLAQQASHDALTGLVNRREFQQRAERALQNARNQNLQHALCFMDLDQFKIVNDTCGHAAGDELLRRVATLLQSRVRQRDTLARLGGDEFGLLLENCPLDEAERVATEMLNAIRNFRFDWEGKTFTIGVSIGVSAITSTSGDTAAVLSATDAACYAAKEKGRNRVQMYKSDDRELAERQGEMRLVSRISNALDQNRFALFFQPIVTLRGPTRAGEHGEILVRMITPEKQLVPPERFIPAAERYNLMPLLDRWVIQNAFASYSKIFPDKAERERNMWAINISGTSLGSVGFIDFIREQRALHQVPPQAICFEITETAAISNVSKAVDFIWALKVEGFRFALDDFGKGMSSFSYLKNLPVHYLKIYGDFVKDICHDKISFGMVEAINRIGQMIGLETIAECAESEAILEKLKELGVNYAQGFAIGKPAPLRLHPKGNQLNVYPLSPTTKTGTKP